MQENLFYLNFERWWIFLLSIIPTLINFGIFFYVSYFLPQNKVNRFFSMFVVFLGIAQLSDGFIHMSLSIETASLWNRISVFSMVLALTVGLLFTIYFIKWHKKIHYTSLYIFLFLPVISILFLIISRMDKYVIERSEKWNWIVNPEPTLVTDMIYFWISGTGLSILVILWHYYIKEKIDKRKKMQALLLASGFSIPFIIGIVAEVIFPLIFDVDTIPLATPSITIFSIISLIAIKKYHLFDYSPKHQWNVIIEQMNEGVLIIDNSAKIMYANKTFCSLIEYEFLEMEGKVADELFIESSDRQKQTSISLERRKNKIASQYELQLMTKSRKKIWMLINGSPYIDNNGNVIGFIGIVTNIDHLKKSEEQLRESEKKYHDLFEYSPLPMFVIELVSLKYLNVNEAAIKFYGYSKEEFLNMKALDIWPEEERERILSEMMRNRDRMTDSDGVCKHLKKNGTISYVKIEANPIIFGGKSADLVIVNDVTEITEADRQLKSLLYRFKQAQAIAHVGSWELNFATGIAVWTAEACKIYGISPEENIQSFEFWMSCIHPGDLDYVKKEIEKSQITLSDSSMFHRIVLKDGTIKYVHSISQFEFDTEGKPYGLIGICHDVTEHKKDEDKLKATNQELETYIYKASHDLRGPITSILGLMQIAKVEIEDERSIKYLTMIDTMIQKLDSALIDLIKSMVIKDIEISNDSINFQEMIQETVNGLQPMKDSRLKIYVNVSLSSPFFTSKFILNTIFQNIIENSIKYQHQSREESFLKINISQQENKVKIVFEDNGIGIEESLQHKIFEMYYRATYQAKGSGLGLYLVKKGIEKLNGEIQVTSVLKEGTTFTILI